MYLTEEENLDLLGAIRRMMLHPADRVWLDAVAVSALNGESGHASVDEFLLAMSRLGEPFKFGLDASSTHSFTNSATAFLEKSGHLSLPPQSTPSLTCMASGYSWPIGNGRPDK